MVKLNYIIYLLIITVGFICGIIFKWNTKMSFYTQVVRYFCYIAAFISQNTFGLTFHIIILTKLPPQKDQKYDDDQVWN